MEECLKKLSLRPCKKYYNSVFSFANISLEDLPFNKTTKIGLIIRDD